MTATSNDRDEEVWLIRHDQRTEVHDATSAVYRLASLAFEGALPGTTVTRWWRQSSDEPWSEDSPWEAVR